MSFLTQAYLLDRYGPRLSMAELAHELGWALKTVQNHAAAGKLPIPTQRDAGGRWADYRDVAEYFDSVRPSRTPAEAERTA